MGESSRAVEAVDELAAGAPGSLDEHQAVRRAHHDEVGTVAVLDEALLSAHGASGVLRLPALRLPRVSPLGEGDRPDDVARSELREPGRSLRLAPSLGERDRGE